MEPEEESPNNKRKESKEALPLTEADLRNLGTGALT